jgi:hypothetical protein
VSEPNGRIDVLYQGYHITDTTTYAMDPAYSYFTASSDGGATWSAPVQLGPNNGTMSLAEWWIDGDIARDAAGNLYAVWDTQGATNDIGWLSYSTNHGATWSDPVQVPPDQLNVPHVMVVAGGGPGIAYVSFFSAANPSGYADYLRTFSITRGFLGGPVQVSPEFGDTSLWPGDTFGISTLSPPPSCSAGGARAHPQATRRRSSPHRSAFSSAEPRLNQAAPGSSPRCYQRTGVNQRQPWTTLGSL